MFGQVVHRAAQPARICFLWNYDPSGQCSLIYRALPQTHCCRIVVFSVAGQSSPHPSNTSRRIVKTSFVSTRFLPSFCTVYIFNVRILSRAPDRCIHACRHPRTLRIFRCHFDFIGRFAGPVCRRCQRRGHPSLRSLSFALHSSLLSLSLNSLIDGSFRTALALRLPCYAHFARKRERVSQAVCVFVSLVTSCSLSHCI